eukprot:tig00000101_g4441.t1
MLARSVLRKAVRRVSINGGASSARNATASVVVLSSPAHVLVRPSAANQSIRALHVSAAVAQSAVPATESAPTTTLVGALLDDAVSKFKLRNGLRAATGPDDYLRWTYEELQRHSNAFAVGLLHAGFKPGDRLVALVRPSGELITTQIGCAKIGVTMIVPASVEELSAVLKLYKPRAVLTDPEYNGVDVVAHIAKLIPELENYTFTDGLPLATKSFPTLRHLWHTGYDPHLGGWQRFRDMLLYNEQAHPLSKVAPLVSENAPLLVELSSASTGTVLTERAVVAAGSSIAKGAKLTPEERLCYSAGSLPATSLFLSAAASMSSGSMLAVPKVFAEAKAAQEAEQCTVVLGDAKSLASKPANARIFDLTGETSKLKSGPVRVEESGRVSL